MIDNFSKSGWTAPLKIETAQSMIISFENIPQTSATKPNLIETDHGK